MLLVERDSDIKHEIPMAHNFHRSPEYNSEIFIVGLFYTTRLLWACYELATSLLRTCYALAHNKLLSTGLGLKSFHFVHYIMLILAHD